MVREMKVAFVVGARPNFIKLLPLLDARPMSSVEKLIIDTGQHYDYELSKVFLDELTT